MENRKGTGLTGGKTDKVRVGEGRRRKRRTLSPKTSRLISAYEEDRMKGKSPEN
jgi:hypothetical protein